MTLARQLILVLCVLFALLFVGTLAIAIDSTRDYLAEQMHSHAEDTATSLGLSLKPALESHDVPLMETMINAIFDPGYYRAITVRDTDGAVVIERRLPVRIAGVPHWFVDWLPLRAPSASRELSAGWRIAGTITVSSHPGYAYQELWSVTVNTFWWFLGVFLLVLLAMALVLRVLLRPLRATERQALAICDRRFPVQERLPRTRELNRVVAAMNRMTRKVEQMLADQTALSESMRSAANEDAVTGLANRRSFDARLNALLENRESFLSGALFLCAVNDFKAYNDRRGFEAGDELLRECAALLRQVFSDEPGSILARLGGGTFAVVIRDVQRDTVVSLAETLSVELACLAERGVYDATDAGHIGIACHHGEGSASELLARADMALRAASSQGANAWSLYDEDSLARPDVHGARAWRAMLEDIIDSRRIVLHYQPVMAYADDHNRLHLEVLARIHGADGGLLPAGVFLPMAERAGLAPDFDKVVLETVFARLARDRHGPVLAVNLSPASLRDTGFVDWLEERLTQVPDGARRLALEVPEYGVASDQAAVEHFLHRIAASGVRFGLDHFGVGAVSLRCLKRFMPAYIKIDGSYIRAIDATADNQFLVQSVADIAHSLDIQVIGEAVETEPEWHTLRRLHVDAAQGYHVGRPGAAPE